MTRIRSLLSAGRVCALLAASSGLLYAQSNAVGNVSGTVTGPDHKPLPGAVVRVDTGRGIREARADEKGRFLFTQLLPGTLKVRVTAPDLQTFQTQATVIANQTLTLGIPMARISSATIEVISVLNREVGVDTTAAVSGKSITSEEIATLPSIGSVYDAFLATVPGTPSGGYNFHGSEDGSNGYTVNGVESRSANGGTQMLSLNRDLIEQFNVLSSGVSAKYGRFVGATVATITKSGTNEFTGSIHHDLTSASWNALPKPAPYKVSERVPRAVTDSQSYTLLGPIIRDKLFFTAGYQVTSPNYTAMVHSSLGSGLFEPFTFANTSRSELKDLRLDWQVNTDHRFNASWNHFLSTGSGAANGWGLSSPATDTGGSRSETGFSSFGYSGVLASNLLVDGIYSETETKSRIFGSPGGAGVVSWVDHYGPGNGDIYDNGLVGSSSNQEKIRTLGLNLTWIAGSHSVEAGFQYYASRIESSGSYDAEWNPVTPSHALIWFNGWDKAPAGMDRQYRHLAVGDTSTSRLTTLQPLSGTFDSRVWGLYVNDVWTLNPHWTFNLGARFDSNQFKTSPEGQQFTVGTTVPRLSVNYDLLGDRAHTFTLGLAEYAGQISASTFTSISVANVSPSRYYAYFGAGTGADALNPDGTINWNVWGRSATELGEAYPVYASPDPLTDRRNSVAPDIKPPRAREATLAYRYMDKNQSLTATLLHKVQDHYIGMKRIGSPGLGVNQAPNVYWNDDGMKSRYENFELQYQRQILEDLSLGGNLTWAYTRANAGQGVGPGPRNKFGDAIPNDLVAPTGPQSGQWSSSTTPFTAHMDAAFKHSFGRLGSVVATLQGNYWSRSFQDYRSFMGPTSQAIQDAGYSDTVTRVFADAETWWPEQYSFNLHLGYEVEVFRKVKVFAALDIMNLFNHMMPMYVNYSTAITDGTRTYVPGDSLPSNWYLNPAFKAVGYNEPNPDNNPWIMRDGQVGAYTSPRAIKLQAGFRF